MRRRTAWILIVCGVVAASCQILLPLILWAWIRHGLEEFLVDPSTCIDLHQSGATNSTLNRAVVDYEKVRTVSLRGNPQITNGALDTIQRMPNLEQLSLKGCDITDRGLSQLTGLSKLKSLDLSRTAVSDQGMLAIAKMRQLAELELDGTQIGDAGVSHLAAHPGLQRLSLYGTAITDESMKTIATLSRLDELYIGDTRVGDRGMSHLASLKSLQQLGMEGTPLTDAGAEAIGKIRSLKGVGMGHTSVGDGAIRSLVSLPQIYYLGFENMARSNESAIVILTEVEDSGISRRHEPDDLFYIRYSRT
ncbi:MAG: leucine-rich repeat domain-containing protein, partial [Pirellulales bacterium]